MIYKGFKWGDSILNYADSAYKINIQEISYEKYLKVYLESNEKQKE